MEIKAFWGDFFIKKSIELFDSLDYDCFGTQKERM